MSGVLLADADVLVEQAGNGDLAWVQVGADIHGEAAGDDFGLSVVLSADGSRLAVGAEGNDGAGEDAGHVRVFDWDGAAWTQIGADIDGEAAGDGSGWSVALAADGSRLAVGAPLNSDAGQYAGHVRVFDWDGSAWTQVGVDLDGESTPVSGGVGFPGDRFGRSVALSADGARLAVHAQGEVPAAGLGPGYVRVFDWDGAAWSQAGTDIETLDSFGMALSADGARVAIGARNPDSLGPGFVKVFGWDGAAWAQVGPDIRGEDVEQQHFGTSVALSADGTRIVISNPTDWNDPPPDVRAFDWDGAAWTQVGADIDAQMVTGVGLSADGRRVMILTSAGSARVVDWDGSVWTQVGADISAPADHWGAGHALSADGLRLAVGALPEYGVQAEGVRVFGIEASTPDSTTVPPAATNAAGTSPATDATSTTAMIATSSTTIAAPGGVTLPSTGAGNANGALLGAVFAVAGLTLVALARRRILSGARYPPK